MVKLEETRRTEELEEAREKRSSKNTIKIAA